MFFVLTTPNYWSNYDNYSTFASISFTTDYADFTDFFLANGFAITQIFSDLTDKNTLQGFEKSV